ncbi:MAG TPA: transporter substrate-binding domain-containing protein [Alphaproteobacteria bacterium]|nr:transporter substrate-binding domain-containing protein [Alphaproteobacteria bacterium]
MQTTRWAFATLLALLAPAFAPASAAAAEAHYFVIDNVRPLQIGTPDSPMQGGLVTEVVAEIFRDSPHTLAVTYAPWPRVEKLMETTPNFLTYGWDGDPKYRQTAVSMFPWRNVIISPKASDFRFTRVEDLYDRMVILMYGYDYVGLDEHLSSRTPGGRIHDSRPKSQAEALQMLLAGRGVAFVELAPRALYIIREAGLDPSGFKFQDFSSVVKPVPTHLMMDRNIDPELARHIDDTLAAMEADGRLAGIVAKYFPDPSS